jgi:hypothetical protein
MAIAIADKEREMGLFAWDGSLVPGFVRGALKGVGVGFAAWEGYPSRELPLPVEGEREESMPERAKGMMVGSPAREVLPGVFASGGLEVVYYIRCGARAVLVDTEMRVYLTDGLRARFRAAPGITVYDL